jgi:hypothetical protein
MASRDTLIHAVQEDRESAGRPFCWPFISTRLECVPRIIEHTVHRIRLLWKHELKDLKS